MFLAQDHRRSGIKRNWSVASTAGEHGCQAQIESPCFPLPSLNQLPFLCHTEKSCPSPISMGAQRVANRTFWNFSHALNPLSGGEFTPSEL